MARPIKLNHDVQKRIAEALKLGASYDLASRYGGISYRTFIRWMQRGEKGNIKYREFHEEINKACGEMAIRALLRIEQAASKGDWRASAWKLERMYLKTYGKKSNEEG